MGRIPKDALPLYLPRNHVNGLLAALDLIIHTDEKNEMAVSAQKLKDKDFTLWKGVQVKRRGLRDDSPFSARSPAAAENPAADRFGQGRCRHGLLPDH